ncbi:sugar transport protein 13-like [Selaginella moellendorffii]|uniref:sugar transport protein 13-like n=1 Tax=Selaginella moellendorffii TaxID=88036 RepID=UPI000D1CEB47|nr:sugar transport protein 13-like [Selaginella moellendorffii]|eukprot:XP_024530304.1 sugar transport protein 13-like [Selaginella moellendorffii]
MFWASFLDEQEDAPSIATGDSQVVVAVILGVKFGGTKELDKVYAVIVVIVICCYVSAFAWSWGPFRSQRDFPTGDAIGRASDNLFFTFVIAQAFLSMCHMKFGIFLFFAAWVAIMSVFSSDSYPRPRTLDDGCVEKALSLEEDCPGPRSSGYPIQAG